MTNKEILKEAAPWCVVGAAIPAGFLTVFFLVLMAL